MYNPQQPINSTTLRDIEHTDDAIIDSLVRRLSLSKQAKNAGYQVKPLEISFYLEALVREGLLPSLCVEEVKKV